MNIPSSILLMELKRYQPRFTGMATDLNFYSIVMEGAPGASYRGNLLVARRSYLVQLGDIDAAALVCIDDSDALLPVTLSVPVILVREDTELAGLYQEVVAIVNQVHGNDGLKKHLISMLAQEVTLDQILRAATKQLGNPFTVFSSTYRLLGHSLIENLATDTAKEAIRTGHMNEGLLQLLQKSGDLGKIQRSGKVEHTVLPNGPEKLSLALHAKGTYMGLISMYNYVRPFHSMDYDMMEFLGNVIRIHLLKGNNYVPFESDKYRAFLTDLIEYPCSPDIVGAKRREFDLSFGSRLMVMLISPSEQDIISKNISLPVLERHWSCILPRSHSFIYQEKLVCLFEADERGSLDEAVLPRVQTFFRENDLYAGVSNLFDDITHFKVHFEQSQYVLQKAKENTRLSFFFEYISEYLLEVCARSVSLQHLLHPKLRVLAEHDEHNGTEYLYTLKTLLGCGGKLAGCAEALGVHYNTVKYRMKSIQAIVGGDLSDLQTMSQLLLGFKIRAQTQQ